MKYAIKTHWKTYWHISLMFSRYNIANSRSNMAIMDIGVVSGFVPHLDQVTVSGPYKRKELANQRVVVYFDDVCTPWTNAIVSKTAHV